MAGRQTYPCFACRKAGHEVQVFLDGKDGQGRTKYLNEDGTGHTHYYQQEQQQQQQQYQYHDEEGGSSFEIESLQERQKEEQREEQLEEQTYLAKVTDESVKRGITALKLFSDLALQVEGIGIDCNQTRVILEDVQKKLDKLLNIHNLR
jgi:hypothetical protein